MSLLEDWPDVFAVSVRATVSAAIYLRSFFCHDIANFNAANSEMFRVNTFVNLLFSLIGEKLNLYFWDLNLSVTEK